MCVTVCLTVCLPALPPSVLLGPSARHLREERADSSTPLSSQDVCPATRLLWTGLAKILESWGGEKFRKFWVVGGASVECGSRSGAEGWGGEEVGRVLTFMRLQVCTRLWKESRQRCFW